MIQISPDVRPRPTVNEGVESALACPARRRRRTACGHNCCCAIRRHPCFATRRRRWSTYCWLNPAEREWLEIYTIAYSLWFRAPLDSSAARTRTDQPPPLLMFDRRGPIWPANHNTKEGENLPPTHQPLRHEQGDLLISGIAARRCDTNCQWEGVEEFRLWLLPWNR